MLGHMTLIKFLACSDDKICMLEDGVESLVYWHKDIEAWLL